MNSIAPITEVQIEDGMKMTINLVRSCRSKQMDMSSVIWDELRKLFQKPHRKGDMPLEEYFSATDAQKRAEKDGMAFIPCSVKNQDGPRNQENMDEAFLLVLDIDTGMDLVDVKRRIEGHEAVIHTSFSHRPEHTKYRVVMPLAAPIPAKVIGKVFDHFQEKFDGFLDAACGHDPSRLYYLPACPADAEPLFHYEYIEGSFLDAQAILDERRNAATMPVTRSKPTAPKLTVHKGVHEGGRNNACFKLAAGLFRDGNTEEDVLAGVLEWNAKNTPPLDEEEVRQTVESAQKTVERNALRADAQIDEIVSAMNGKYAWVRKQNAIYRFEHRDFIKVEALRQTYANTPILVPVGDKMQIQTHADIWFKSPDRRTHADVDFVPGEGQIVGDKLNFWRGWAVTPSPGDITPWRELLDYLFDGNADARKWVEQWVAYPLQYPGVKQTTALVIWSIQQGVGKTMVAETVGKLYGEHFKVISAAELHSSFNGWARDALLILGEENSSADQRADSNRLKNLITGTTVFINEKFQPALELPNCMNFFFTSNHPDAFHLEDSDRRFFVWEITSKRKPDKFYEDFVEWRENRGGLAALMDHLLKVDLTGFQPKGIAPMTQAKQEMIRQSKSELERWLGEVLEDNESVEQTFGKEISTLDEITELFNLKHRTRVSSTAVSRALRRHHQHKSRRVSAKSGRKMVMSLIDHEKWDREDSDSWVEEYEKSSPRMML